MCSQDRFQRLDGREHFRSGIVLHFGLDRPIVPQPMIRNPDLIASLGKRDQCGIDRVALAPIIKSGTHASLPHILIIPLFLTSEYMRGALVVRLFLVGTSCQEVTAT